MTGTLRRSLEELRRSSRQELPKLCNVLVQVDAPPVRVSQQGGRWQLPVRSLSETVQAFVVVHDEPAATGLSLGYMKTSEFLFAMFKEEPLRRLFVPGEIALVQAEPRLSASGELFLNVQTILLLRPFQTFGRTQVDFESRCSRKSYLSIAKGVSNKPPGEFHLGNVGGMVAHDVFSYLAEGGLGKGGTRDEVLTAALGIETVGSLVFLGLRSPADMEAALRQGLEVQEVVARSEALRQFICADLWAPESNVLNNGITVAPDLLGQSHVAELKYIKPSSQHADPESQRVQVEAYLAWAMVEYGLPEVCSQWKGLLVQLHPLANEAARVQAFQAQPELIGTRLLNRHRLLALTNGAWLPPPSPDECNRCEFSDYASRREGHLAAPPCTFHCQMERGWDCYSSPPGRPCPLIDKCDQYDRFIEFERVDQFNRLRGDLLDEEEERAAITQILESLTGRDGGEATGLVLGGLKVIEHKRGSLKIELPSHLQVLDFAHRDELFELLHKGRPTGLVRIHKRKGMQLVLTEVQATGRLLATGTHAALRAVPEWRLGPREQLRYLDLVQRLNETPMSLRIGSRREQLPIIQRLMSLEHLSSEVRLALVDAPGRATLRNTAQKVLDRMRSGGSGRVLVVDAIEGLTPSDAMADLSDIALSEEFSAGTEGAQEQLRALVERIRGKRVWCVPREFLFGVRLSTLVEYIGPFSDILVIGAETFPLIAVDRCLALGKRTVLIGQAAAGGPRAESARARQSELYQNTLRFLLEAGSSVFPGDIDRVESVRLPAAHGCVGLDRILGFEGIARATRLEVHVCAAPEIVVPVGGSSLGGENEIELTRFVPRSPNQVQTRHLIVEMLPSERGSVRHLKEMLKGITARSIERISITAKGHIDTSLFGERVRIVDITQATVSEMPRSEHQVTLRVPHARFPFIQERLFTSMSEAEAVIAFVQQHPHQSYHATSPFFAQCILISRLAAEKGITNLTVLPLEHLGWKRSGGDRVLLVSTVITKANPDYPFPMNNSGRLLEFFAGDYSEVNLFSTGEALKRHPLLSRLIGQRG